MHRHNVLPLSTALLVAANLLIPVAIILFAIGFFPYKPFLPGLAEYKSFEYGPPPQAPFDRLIFMVIDALRSDFVFTNNSGFQFTQGLISDGVAIPFTAHATSPTITMPRIKAITTGSTPSFLDAILSFDEADTSSTLAVQDTWLAQMKAKKEGKLVMYGDDTWLKLFPGIFDRADGTSSFFVSDFTEVDNNVTRHIPDELRNDDWNTMVLHYLGLDHIGHKTGPRGPNMIPKQHEMDGIVRMIYEAMQTQPHLQSTLLVFCGDHGMNDAGNHGASSPGETSAALVFVSPKLKSISKPVKVPAEFVEDFQLYNVVEQSDLAPTLAALLGFPVPKNSLGSFILEFLPFWSERHDKRQILLRNARQILDIVAATYISSSPTGGQYNLDCARPGSVGEELICEWQNISISVDKTPVGDMDDGWITDASKWLYKAQALMSSVASNYDMSMLACGGVTTALASTLAMYVLSTSTSTTALSLAPFVLITVLYGVMMFASSYVEEEQHFWYWATSAWLLYLTIRSNLRMPRKSLAMGLIALGSMRLVRGWNQTGQKFAGEPDVVTSFVAANPPLLWCLVTATYALVTFELFNGLGDIPAVVSGSVASGLATSAISFKLAFTNEDAPELVVGLARTLVDIFDGPSLVNRARAVFLGLGLTSIYPLYSLLLSENKSSKEKAMRTLHHLYTLFALTQSRVTNIPLFLLFQAIYLCLSGLRLDVTEITTSSLLLQFSSFFAMGGSNAISGVDLSSAYNGVSGFNIIAVGILTFVSNWAAPVWWTSALNLLLIQKRQPAEYGSHSVYRQHTAILTVFVTVTLGFVMMACTALRTHLFIWTVFSPKYLYSMAWTLGQHMVINVAFGGLLYWLGRT
ncbi:alkaline phosphatase-like protein [Annulohypoxylon truncatum]|uniref:alkaline phosphatase-like protein n=1 Tax=Annulohypoxylon truncatum TaxID=327061 RepID=UPI002008816B|nr:alkaline phosphatase-like protein [Annulohypoxylon truncatum]KAI1206541.1 alkaline phosphatase-like protein [Annulohypoxylon truncatum]